MEDLFRRTGLSKDLKEVERVSKRLYGKGVPDRKYGECKGPEAGAACLVCSRKTREPEVLHQRDGKSQRQEKGPGWVGLCGLQERLLGPFSRPPVL